MRRLRWLGKKRVWIPLVILVVAFVVVSFFRGGEEERSIAFSDVIAAGRSGTLEKIDVYGHRVDVRLRGESRTYSSTVGSDTDVTRALQEAGVTIGGATPASVTIEYHDPRYAWVQWIVWIISIALVGAVVYFAVFFAMRRSRRE